MPKAKKISKEKATWFLVSAHRKLKKFDDELINK
jgi:hypothetical protein